MSEEQSNKAPAEEVHSSVTNSESKKCKIMPSPAESPPSKKQKIGESKGITESDLKLDYCYVLDFKIQHKGEASEVVKECLVKLHKDVKKNHHVKTEGVPKNWNRKLGPYTDNIIGTEYVELIPEHGVLFTAIVYGNPLKLTYTQHYDDFVSLDKTENDKKQIEKNIDDSSFYEEVFKNARLVDDHKYIFYSSDYPTSPILHNHSYRKTETNFRTRLTSKHSSDPITDKKVIKELDTGYEYIQINWDFIVEGDSNKVISNYLKARDPCKSKLYPL